jgi:hypothetical protein
MAAVGRDASARTVLEVIGTTSEAGEVHVIAGMGSSSDWFRNIAANPQQLVVGRRRFARGHRVLDESEAVIVVGDNERGNRWLPQSSSST